MGIIDTNPWLIDTSPVPIIVRDAPPVVREPAGKGKFKTTVSDNKNVAQMEYKGPTGTHEFKTEIEDNDDAYFQILNTLETKKEQQQIQRQEAINQLSQFQQSVAENTNEYLANSPLATMDLRPAAALVDAWTGSNLAQATGKPLDVNDRVKLIQGLQEKIAEQKDKMAEGNTAIDLLKLETLKDREANKVKSEMSAQMMGARFFQGEQSALAKQQAANKPRVAKNLSEKASRELAGNEEARALIADFISYIKTNPDRLRLLSKIKSLDPTKSDKFAPEQEMAKRFTYITQKIGRILEGGVLRDADWKKYVKLFGDINTNPGVALATLRSIEYDMLRSYRMDINAYTKSGYETGQWRKNPGKLSEPTKPKAPTTPVAPKKVSKESLFDLRKKLSGGK